jgi:hypothetical protein
MDRFIRTLVLALLLLPAAQLHAELSFAVAPSVGIATITNIDGYTDAAFLRVDGSFYPLPQVAVNVFATKYADFENSGGGSDVAIELQGGGVGVIGRWPVDPHFMPYLRAEYLLWSAKATGLDRTLAEDDGGSAGLAIGAHFPINRRFGVKTEFGGYNNVSGANIRQISLGLVIEF